MLRILILALALVPALVSCSSSNDSEPTPDTARYSARQVQQAINTAAKSQDRVGCSSTLVKYAGDGMWTCGSWTFDERTGQAFR